MYRRLIWVVVIVLMSFAGKGQVSVSLQEPPPGIVQKNQLWNLALIYSGTIPVNVVIGLSLVDMADNQPVLTAFTRPLTLTKGARQLKVADVSPVDYNYLSATFSRLADALLPVGNYRACYTIYDAAKEAGVLAEDCISIDVQPLSPPQLTMPADAATIETPYPQFSWLPPAPVTLFSDLNYDLLVTEVRSDQTASSAIQENIPIYNIRRLTAMVNNYPSSGKSLDTGKVYAWRVVAKNGETFAAQSEVWTFQIGREKPAAPVPSGGKYLELKSGSAYMSTAIIPGNVLGIKYYSYDKSREAKVMFSDASGKTVKEVDKTITYGNNFLVFTLDDTFSTGAVYFIEITDLQGSLYRASFSIAK